VDVFLPFQSRAADFWSQHDSAFLIAARRVAELAAEEKEGRKKNFCGFLSVGVRISTFTQRLFLTFQPIFVMLSA